MAKTVKVLFRSYLPGSAGQDLNGVPKQGKQLVMARMDISAYTASGEPLSAADLGLETIDYINFDVVSVNDAATVPASGAIPLAAYDTTGDRVIVNIDHGADTAVTTGEAAVLNIWAVGDSVEAPELT